MSRCGQKPLFINLRWWGAKASSPEVTHSHGFEQHRWYDWVPRTNPVLSSGSDLGIDASARDGFQAIRQLRSMEYPVTDLPKHWRSPHVLLTNQWRWATRDRIIADRQSRALEFLSIENRAVPYCNVRSPGPVLGCKICWSRNMVFMYAQLILLKGTFSKDLSYGE